MLTNLRRASLVGLVGVISSSWASLGTVVRSSRGHSLSFKTRKSQILAKFVRGSASARQNSFRSSVNGQGLHESEAGLPKFETSNLFEIPSGT
jgi:hypothetical protein